jgi:hypothetical protein
MNRQKSMYSIILAILLSFGVNAHAKIGNFKTTEEVTLQLGTFSKVQLDGGYEVVLIQGNEESVTIAADKEKISSVHASVKEGKLHVYNDKYAQNYKVKLTIKFKNLEKIKFNGGVSLKCNNLLEFNNLELNIAGGADIKLNLKANDLKYVLDGGVNTDLIGQVVNLSLALNGAGRINAEELHAENVKVEIAGAGYAVVYGSKTVNAEISGIGSIEYTGNPQKVKSVVNGLGSIKEKEKE